jgi:Zinc finger, C2H2 type
MQIEDHWRDQTRTFLQCDLCDYKSTVMRRIEHHRTHSHKERAFQCSKCPKKFVNRYSIKQHELLTHTANPELYKCDCGKLFKSKTLVNSHRKNNHKNKAVKYQTVLCQYCKKVFHRKSNLRKHILSVHTERQPCAVCGAFLGPGNMSNHLKTHKKTKCSFSGCDREFIGENQVRYHIKNEHESTQVQCQMCDAVFTSQEKLNRHIIRHTRKVCCSIDGCKYSTHRRDYLAMHYRNHKGIDEDQRKKALEDLKYARNDLYE